MNKINHIYLIFIFIIISPILDASVVFTNLPISTLIRGIFFIFSYCYLLKTKQSLKITALLSLIMLLFASYQLTINYTIMEIITNILKLFYLPITTLLFYNLKYDKLIDKTMFITLMLYISIYLLSYLFNFGYNAYLENEGKIGYKGLFNSINELSAILLILYYYSYQYIKKHKVMLTLITILMFIIAYLTGTKVLLGGLIIILLLNLMPKFINTLKRSSTNKKLIISILAILFMFISGYLFTFSTTFYNMKIQGDFFKVNNILSFDFINKVLFNDRLSFLSNNFNIYSNANIIYQIFGLNIKEFPKLVEIDIFDICFLYGIIGLGYIIAIFTIIFKKIKFKFQNLIALIILLLISLTSGHVLLKPAVSIYFGIIIYINKKRVKS